MGLVKLLFSFQGRITRSQYWLGNLLAGAIYGVIVGLMAGMVRASVDAQQSVAAALASFVIVYALLFIMLLWNGFAIQVKRLHDRGRTGWLTLLPLSILVLMIAAMVNAGMSASSPEAGVIAAIGAAAPYWAVLFLVNIWFFIELGCLPSKEGPNKYDGPASPNAPTSPTPPPRSDAPVSAPAANSAMALFQPAKAQAAAKTSLAAAEQAIARAVAEKSTQQTRSAPAKPVLQGSFGQRIPTPMRAAPASFGKRGA